MAEYDLSGLTAVRKFRSPEHFNLLPENKLDCAEARKLFSDFTDSKLPPEGALKILVHHASLDEHQADCPSHNEAELEQIRDFILPIYL